jgi:hypothetical protein
LKQSIRSGAYIELDGSPYHCLDVEISRPTARGGQTLVRVKMRNLLTRAVFDRTFKAAEKFAEPDLAQVTAAYLYADAAGDARDRPRNPRAAVHQRRRTREGPPTTGQATAADSAAAPPGRS